MSSGLAHFHFLTILTTRPLKYTHSILTPLALGPSSTSSPTLPFSNYQYVNWVVASIPTTYSVHQVFSRPRKSCLQNCVRLRKRIFIFLKKCTELRAEILGPRRIRGPGHFERKESQLMFSTKRAKKGLPNGSPVWFKVINASQSVGATRKLRGASSAI
jgi:hypothetical protein